ncbi:MAG: AMP-binding protein, partial [Gemmatimonadota bacterium]|nr:AMP-binding protein [Gemmatimonadota bacterium]
MATETTSTSRVTPLQPVERNTIPRIFLGGVDRSPAAAAMQYKQGGAWKTLSRQDVEERVASLAAALAAAGIERGDRVAILSENRPEWAIVDYAAVGSGLSDVPIYPTLPPNQIAYILRDSGARAILVSTREQLDKVLLIRDELPGLEQVISFDEPRGAAGTQHFEAVLEGGRRALAGGSVRPFRELALEVEPDDVATLIYTSGTTGDPKGVMLTQFNIASNVAAAQQHGVLKANPGDVALSFLPLSHIFERTADYFYWDTGTTIAYAESIEKVADNMGEVRPHLMVAVPRLYDKIYTKVMGATGIKKKLVMWAKGVGEAIADERFAGREPAGALAFQGRLA